MKKHIFKKRFMNFWKNYKKSYFQDTISKISFFLYEKSFLKGLFQKLKNEKSSLEETIFTKKKNQVQETISTLQKWEILT